jgi:hypothetical protein
VHFSVPGVPDQLIRLTLIVAIKPQTTAQSDHTLRATNIPVNMSIIKAKHVACFLFVFISFKPILQCIWYLIICDVERIIMPIFTLGW